MRCHPLHDELSYGPPSAPVEALIAGTRYSAIAGYDTDRDEFDYRLTIARPGIAPIVVSPVRLGLFGRDRGARIEWQGVTTTIRDTVELADPDLRAALERAFTSASAVSAGAPQGSVGLRRKGTGLRRRSQRPHTRSSQARSTGQAGRQP